MAETYDIQALANDLSSKGEMDPDEHDGCYRLMRETVAAYARLQSLSSVNYRDLDLLYLTTVLTLRHGIESKKKVVRLSNLAPADKDRLCGLWDDAWAKASDGQYGNVEPGASGKPTLGLFGTGFMSFRHAGIPDERVREFVAMLVDILPMEGDEEMFRRVADVLDRRIPGMQAGAASMMLHCLKPLTFPVLNGNQGNDNVFALLGVELVRPGDLDAYVENCRRVKAYRDANFACRNYRIFDLEAGALDDFRPTPVHGGLGPWEMVGDDVVRRECDGETLERRGTMLPDEVATFFGWGETLGQGQVQLGLEHDGRGYEATLLAVGGEGGGVSMLWGPDLSRSLASELGGAEGVALEFRRTSGGGFSLDVVARRPREKAWLIAWNRENWPWEGYAEACRSTAAGNALRETWSCSSTAPNPGDEVFLVKLGKQPRGLVGHGTVVRGTYDAPHYDPSKAAEGRTRRCIDVEFDRLVDYENEDIVTHKELVERCAAQNWSPMASGIRIKDEVLPTVRSLWERAGASSTFGLGEVVSFLEDYGGSHYTVPEKAGDGGSAMLEMRRRGQDARKRFVSFAKSVASSVPGMEFVHCSSWLNQGQTVPRYLWAELKDGRRKDATQSISMNIEPHVDEVYPGEGYYLSVRVELNDRNATDGDYERMHRLLDCELIDGMTFRVSHVDGTYHGLGRDADAVRRLRDEGTLLKLTVIEAVEDLEVKDRTGSVLTEAARAVMELYPLYRHVLGDGEDGWRPATDEYDPGIDAGQYEEILRRGYSSSPDSLSTLYYLHRMGGSATCTEIADRYGDTAPAYIARANAVMRRVASESGCPLPEGGPGKRGVLWPVLFYGRNTRPGERGTFVWRLREPLEAAIASMEGDGFFASIEGGGEWVSEFDHNTILYGPPGTGKTYNSAVWAVAICDGRRLDEVRAEGYSTVHARYEELRAEGRIVFTTFHQSYGYEEFIEGIRPVMSEGDGAGDIAYAVSDGVFKRLCNVASGETLRGLSGLQAGAGTRIWGMILGGTGSTELKRECFANGEVRLGWSEVAEPDAEGDSAEGGASEAGRTMVAYFREEMAKGDVVLIERTNTSIDAIGVVTGDYEYDASRGRYPRSREVEWLATDLDRDMLEFLPAGRKQLSRHSLHPLDYIGMGAVDKMLAECGFAPGGARRKQRPYVLVIDEINRGNVSKVFGELITLIEETKRAGMPEAMEAVLPYSGETFSVPANVYVLGTMNTADRSIALMDTALRRRFEFVEMMPDPEVLRRIGADVVVSGDETLDVAAMLGVINARIECLYDREHTIGHAFFTRLAQSPTIEILAEIFKKDVLPLLQEYFYEDWEKIQLVLGDNAKEDELKFVLDTPLRVRDVFRGSPDVDLPERSYRIQPEAFLRIESYKQIGDGL